MTYSDFPLETRQRSWEQESEVLQIIHEVIDLHFSLFKTPGELPSVEDNEKELIWLQLTTRAFHSSRVAFHALERAYYAQCFMLARSVLEDWLTAFDCLSNDKTVEALLYSRGRVPTFSDMAGKLPDDWKVPWRGVGDTEGEYGWLSAFSHPRPRALEATANASGMVLVVPEYNEIRFALAAKDLLQVTLPMLDFLERLADYLATPESLVWKSRNLKEVKPRGLALLGSLLHRLKSYGAEC
jgi:hypothetical protein